MRTGQRKTRRTLIQGATLVTVDDQDRVLRADLLIEDGAIASIEPKLSARGIDEIIDAKGLIAIPGFVQGHIHLCQSLFRAQADDMALLDWLSTCVWPMEAALEPDDLRASARLGIAELLLSGTTTALDMGTVRHTEVLFEEARRFGLRYTGGKCLMDQGHGFPANLKDNAENALNESIELCERFHGVGLLRYAFSPRFALSCSETVFRRSVVEARQRGALLHTHCAENAEEVDLVRERTGMANFEYLHSLGFSGPDVVLAHGVWLSPSERTTLRKTGTRIAHCPSANLKLASGIARIADFIENGIHVCLGADGAACNNGLDAFMEMRLAALLHKVRAGPTAIPAATALRLATRQGALALGLKNCGSLEIGHRADLTLLDLQKPHSLPSTGDLVSRIVYSARPSDVHTVLVDGKVVVESGALTAMKLTRILRDANSASTRVRERAMN